MIQKKHFKLTSKKTQTNCKDMPCPNIFLLADMWGYKKKIDKLDLNIIQKNNLIGCILKLT